MASGVIYPYPHFNKGEKGAGWRVVDNGGGMSPALVNPGQRIIQVPLEHNCAQCRESRVEQGLSPISHAQGLRQHEACHIRFSTNDQGIFPKVPKRLRQEYWNTVEDARVDYLLREIAEMDQPQILCEGTRATWIERLTTADDKWRILIATALGQPDRPFLDPILKEVCDDNDPNANRLTFDEIIKLRNECWNRLTDILPKARGSYMTTPRGHKVKFPRLKDSIRTALWLQDMLRNLGIDQDAPPDPSEQQQQQGGGGSSSSGQPQQGPQPQLQQPGEAAQPWQELDIPKSPDEQLAEEYESEGDGDEGDEEEGFNPMEEDPSAEKDGEESGMSEMSDPNPDITGSGWCPIIDYQEKPLTRPLPGRLRMDFSPTDTGSMPGDLSRWMTDQKIFKQMRKNPGGTVLIDCSGSMSISQDQLWEWLLEFPGCKIATYNGAGDTGYLWIVAQKGSVADEFEINPPGGYNGIDGPALRWLMKQARPRVWVSDGYVNGRSGSGGTHLDFERDMLVARGRILWVDVKTIDRSGGIEDYNAEIVKRVREALNTGRLKEGVSR